MVTSDFRPEVEIRPFRACAMKNMQYNVHLSQNHRNSRVLKEIGVEEHDGDVIFLTGSGNMAVSRMKDMQYNAFISKSPKFQRLKGNWGRGTRW